MQASKSTKTRFLPMAMSIRISGICEATKYLKDTSVSEPGHLLSEISDKAMQMPESVCLLEVARRERAQTGLFSINAANGQPRLGMTDDILNLLCHFIGN